MQAWLVLVVVASASTAVACLVQLARLRAAERARQTARVHALAQALDGPASLDEGPVFASSAHEAAARPGMAFVPTAALVLLMAGTWVLTRTAASSGAPPWPLELLALNGQRDSGALTISGMVRNPAAGGVVDAVSVHVRAFDVHGRPVASHDTALQARRLQPGDRSSFTVSIPSATVTRYQVTFRSPAGVVPHVDHRTP